MTASLKTTCTEIVWPSLREPSAVEEVTLVIVGAPVFGMTAVEALDIVEVPSPFVAVLLNVYVVPFVSPVTSQEVFGTVTVQVFGPLIGFVPALSYAVTV